MLLSTQTGTVFAAYGIDKGIELYKEAGYDALDFSFMDPKYYSSERTKDYFEEIRKKSEECGLCFNQAHAPFHSSFADEEATKQRFKDIVKSIEYASYLGIKNIVVHPCQHLEYRTEKEKLFEINMDFYNRLKPYCEEYGVHVAVENMWQSVGNKILHSTCSSPEEFIRYIDELNSEWFVACLDLGHSMLVCNEPKDFIRALGSKRLKALHVHDVDGIKDLHTLPYFGIIDWDSVAEALADIGYTGDFTFEADSFLVGKPKELYPQMEKTMVDTGRYIINKFNNYKK